MEEKGKPTSGFFVFRRIVRKNMASFSVGLRVLVASDILYFGQSEQWIKQHTRKDCSGIP